MGVRLFFLYGPQASLPAMSAKYESGRLANRDLNAKNAFVQAASPAVQSFVQAGMAAVRSAAKNVLTPACFSVTYFTRLKFRLFDPNCWTGVGELWSSALIAAFKSS